MALPPHSFVAIDTIVFARRDPRHEFDLPQTVAYVSVAQKTTGSQR